MRTEPAGVWRSRLLRPAGPPGVGAVPSGGGGGAAWSRSVWLGSGRGAVRCCGGALRGTAVPSAVHARWAAAPPGRRPPARAGAAESAKVAGSVRPSPAPLAGGAPCTSLQPAPGGRGSWARRLPVRARGIPGRPRLGRVV